jgi:hypothetical protein
MNWKLLTIDDLKTILSEDEANTLNTFSIDEQNTTIVNDCINMIADMWRGALAAKGYAVDMRPHYVPVEYIYWILVHCRYAVWTRFPMSPSIALDEARKAEYEAALEILKEPYIGPSKPDPENDPTNPANGGSNMGMITLPFLRFNDDLYWYNSLSVL